MQNQIKGQLDINIEQFMNDWVLEEGYPVLDVTVNEKRTIAYVTQKRFLLKDATHDDDTTWQIPISYATENSDFDDTKPSSIFSVSEAAVHQIAFGKKIDWLILNVQQTSKFFILI